MPAARSVVPHLRCQFGGTLGSSAQEIWSCTWNLVSATGGSGGAAGGAAGETRAALTTAAAAIRDDLLSFHAAVGASFAVLNYVKLNYYGADDLQGTDPTIDVQFAGAAGGHATDVPFSTALVFEHRTLTRSRGFASHGRISYPAGISVDSGSGMVVGIGNQGIGAISTLYAQLLAKIKADSPGGAYEVGILYTSLSSAKPAASSVVDRVFASSIPGEIRRRQNKLKQTSAAVTVVGAA